MRVHPHGRGGIRSCPLSERYLGKNNPPRRKWHITLRYRLLDNTHKHLPNLHLINESRLGLRGNYIDVYLMRGNAQKEPIERSGFAAQKRLAYLP
jgi:hypothetical protein